MPGLTLRFTPAELAALKQRHAETFHAHRLALTVWMARRQVRGLRPRAQKPAAKEAQR